MRGWVYVIGNRSMPGLWKIGFTEKTPEKRAEELNHTGIPIPYEVIYKIEIEGPRDIEQKAHRFLAPKREGKEWFRCRVEEAIVAIKVVAAEAVIISEAFPQAEREKIEALHKIEQQRYQAEQTKLAALRKIELRRKQAADRLWQAEQDIHRKYDEQIRACFEYRKLPFRYYWIGSVIFLFVLLIIYDHQHPKGMLFLSIMFGFLSALFLHNYFESYHKSSLYTEIQKQREMELTTVRAAADKVRNNV